MRNPLENEDAAFRFVLGTIAFLAPIVLASWIATWLGVTVLVAATAVVVVLFRRGRALQADGGDAGRAAVENTWRILVLANETLEGARLREAIVRLSDGVAEDVLVVCPVGVQGSSIRGPESDRARTTADVRLRDALTALRAAGVNARGELGDGDPVAALDGALQRFAADEIVIATRSEGHSPWLERGVVAAVGAHFDGPVTHVIGDTPLLP